MSTKTLFVELFQPFAQYRNPFTFYYAQTFPLPPKSTIIGMLQNACDDWYGRSRIIEGDRLENKWWDLKISIHGGFESVFWNYQQLIKGEVNIQKIGNNIIMVNQNMPLYGEGLTSQRSPVYQQELFNGHLFILIKGDYELIEDIKRALEKPRKVLSLGRSEDVVFIKKVSYVENIETRPASCDIKLKYPTYLLLNGFPLKREKYPVYSIPVKVIFKNSGRQVTHKAEINKDTEREVEFKTVLYTGYDYSMVLNNNIELVTYKAEHDLEGIRIIEQFGWL